MKLCTSCLVPFVAGGLVVGGLIAAGGFAQQEKKQQPPSSPATKPQQPAEKPAMQPEAMPGMEMMGPGPEHAMLKQFEGKWNGKVEMFGEMKETSTGVMNNTWVLDGRWLRQDWNGNMMGAPFKGLGYWGYDRGAKKWSGVWMDTWGTGAMISSGSYDAATKTWTMTGKFTDPMGTEHTMVEKIIAKSPDEHIMEMWGGDMDGDGKDDMMMKITYTRAK